jgi:very-short-patch-repair endonuclease
MTVRNLPAPFRLHPPGPPPRKQGGGSVRAKCVCAQPSESGADGRMMGWRTDVEGWELLRPRARSMRRAKTPAEARLWQRLRRQQLGARFRSQVAIGRFVVDFYCPSHRLIVEVDGDIHEARRDADRQRDAALLSLGLRVLRIRNDEVVRDLDTVVRRIAGALACP